VDAAIAVVCQAISPATARTQAWPAVALGLLHVVALGEPSGAALLAVRALLPATSAADLTILPVIAKRRL